MDGDLILIFGFVLTLLMIILTFGTIAGQRSRENRLQRLEIQARIEEAKAAQVARSSEGQSQLEERVKVLERIVTDPGADLSRQIEDLRAERENREEKVS